MKNAIDKMAKAKYNTKYALLFGSGRDAMEKYSSGRRGAPAKGIGRETGARVQIPPSPFARAAEKTLKNFEKSLKKLLTARKGCGTIIFALEKTGRKKEH